MIIYTPYTYFIGWSSLKTYYYGVRYAFKHDCIYESGCHPDDLFVTYFTSSKIVSDFIEKNGLPDIIQVRKTFSNKEQACLWERTFLKKINAVHRKDFLNKNDRPAPPLVTGRKDSEETRLLKSIATKGPNNAMYGKTGESHPNYGMKHSEEAKNKVSKANKGRGLGVKRQDHSEKMSGSNHFNYGKTTSNETKDKTRQTLLNRPKTVCADCGLESTSAGAMSRHFQKHNHEMLML